MGDQRTNERAVRIAQAMAEQPAASLPKQMHSPAALKATYRFLQDPKVSYERLMRPHLQQTRQQAEQGKPVLLIQDTTEVDYQPHPKTSGLGPIGNGTRQGYLLQTVLAVVPQSREVLGVLHQEPFLRRPAPKKETKAQQAQRERESQVWERSVRAIGRPPPGVHWIHVGDRYSDMFPFLWTCRQQGCDFVIRAAQDRCVDLRVEQADAPGPPRSHQRRDPATAPLHLFEVVRGWQTQGQAEVPLEASKQRKARVARVALSFGGLRLLPPEAQQALGLRPLVVWVVHVWEPEPPEGIEPLEWILLTSVPTMTVEDAWERVDWYRVRWIVEDYHQGLKTGCAIERRQIQTYEGLRRRLWLVAPQAVRLLQLRTAARQAPEQAATQVLPAEVVQVVAALAEVPAAQLTAQQCWHTIARFGGYLGRTGDGPPGWKTLWQGWFYIQSVLDGLHLAARFSLNSSSDP